MQSSIVMPGECWHRICALLLRSPVEQAGVLFAEPTRIDDDLQLRTSEFHQFRAEDFEYQSAFHIELTERAQAWMIKQGWDQKRTIVEVHSHVGSGTIAEFSASDHTGFREFVPHVQWRLRDSPYAAVVVTESGFDSLVWPGAGTPPVAADIVIDNERLRPTGRSLHRKAAANVRQSI